MILPWILLILQVILFIIWSIIKTPGNGSILSVFIEALRLWLDLDSASIYKKKRRECVIKLSSIISSIQNMERKKLNIDMDLVNHREIHLIRSQITRSGLPDRGSSQEEFDLVEKINTEREKLTDLNQGLDKAYIAYESFLCESKFYVSKALFKMINSNANMNDIASQIRKELN